MKARNIYPIILAGCICFACKPEEPEVIVEPEGRLVKEIKEYSVGDWAIDVGYAFSYDANGEVLQVRMQSEFGNKVIESIYDYSRMNDMLRVSRRGDGSDGMDFVYEFDLDESGHIRFDKNHAGAGQTEGRPEPKDWEYRYGEGYVRSAKEGDEERFEFRWNDGNLAEETWFIGDEPSVRRYEYVEAENKTNIEVMSLVGATLGRPGLASPDTRASLFYFGGKKSRNLPMSYSIDGKNAYQYDYTYDSQGCPVRIECRDAGGILQITWEIFY